MADTRAIEIIAMRDRELMKTSGYWHKLWQDAADYCYPTEDQINSKSQPGEDHSTRRYDSTAVMDSQEMASGLSAALIPTGQKFFGLTVKDRSLSTNDDVRQWLMRATEITHEELLSSNFMMHFNESLRSLAVFGTCNLFSQWHGRLRKLNFKDHAINLYQIKEDSQGNVDTVILTYSLSARQAIQEFGGDNLCEDIRKDVTSLETESKRYEFIHVVRPRTGRNLNLSDNRNMPYESLHIDVKAGTVVDESGFEEFPFAVARWMKRACEKWGRGQGTEFLADIRMLQQMRKDYIDLCNRYGKPPLEVAEGFEGTPNITPGAINRVRDIGSIKGIEQQVLGNFPITEKEVGNQQDFIHRVFFRDIFVQISDLKGDRRTTVEIIQRLQEGLRRLASPVARLQSELLTPLITRAIMLLVRNGRIPYPPPELQGQDFGIEYLGPLSLALQAQQANGFSQWAAAGVQLAAVDTSVLDNINMDRGFRRLGEKLGVNADDMATADEVQAKREARAQQQQAVMAMQGAQVAADAYNKGAKAPEEGSPSEAMMGAMQ